MTSVIRANIWQNGAGITYNSVIQSVIIPGTTFDSSAASFQTIVSTSFTPRFANSRIVVTFSGHCYKYHNGLTSSPFRILYGASVLHENNYFFYNSGEYMYAGSFRGFINSPGTTSQTVSFQVNPNGNRCYIYPSTQFLTIEEIAQ
jgi:hypothetical protein